MNTKSPHSSVDSPHSSVARSHSRKTALSAGLTLGAPGCGARHTRVRRALPASPSARHPQAKTRRRASKTKRAQGSRGAASPPAKAAPSWSILPATLCWLPHSVASPGPTYDKRGARMDKGQPIHARSCRTIAPPLRWEQSHKMSLSHAPPRVAGVTRTFWAMPSTAGGSEKGRIGRTDPLNSDRPDGKARDWK